MVENQNFQIVEQIFGDPPPNFQRVEIRGRFVELHTPNALVPNSTTPSFMAVCTPFVPPIQTELPLEDPILKVGPFVNVVLCAVGG